MEKQGIRASIAEAIFADVHETREEEALTAAINPQQEDQEKPPSPTTTGELGPIHVFFSRERFAANHQFNSSKEFENELAKHMLCFKGKETEQNWRDREAAMHFFKACINGNATTLEAFHHHLKELMDSITTNVRIISFLSID